MQIQPINNSNTNFKAMKGIKYAKEFNPRENFDHAKIVDAVLKSNAIKQFGERYDFVARLKHSTPFLSYSCELIGDYYYSLEFLPAPVKKTVTPEKPRLTFKEFIKNIFCKKKNEPVKQPITEEMPKEEENKNIPVSFLVINASNKYSKDATESFLTKIKSLNLTDICDSLQYEMKAIQTEKQRKQEERQEHARILREIENAGF